MHRGNTFISDWIKPTSMAALSCKVRFLPAGCCLTVQTYTSSGLCSLFPVTSSAPWVISSPAAVHRQLWIREILFQTCFCNNNQYSCSVCGRLTPGSSTNRSTMLFESSSVLEYESLLCRPNAFNKMIDEPWSRLLFRCRSAVCKIVLLNDGWMFGKKDISHFSQCISFLTCLCHISASPLLSLPSSAPSILTVLRLTDVWLAGLS